MTSAMSGYLDWLHGLANRYRASQIKAATAVNSEMIKFYWSLGADIVRMEPDQTWGSKFMQHLSADIRRELPGAGCFSCGNLYYMRWFFELYCMRPILPQLGGKLKRAVRANCPPSWGTIASGGISASFPECCPNVAVRGDRKNTQILP